MIAYNKLRWRFRNSQKKNIFNARTTETAMISYDMSQTEGPIYLYLYQRIKEDITSGKIASGSRLPSKRSLARNLGVSARSVENAYGQLAAEGYVYSAPKKGYFVAQLATVAAPKTPATISAPRENQVQTSELFDLSSNKPEIDAFPFSIWGRLMRKTLAENKEKLLNVSDSAGIVELREAIAKHLSSFRAMTVEPGQIVVGAGTEYLYGLIVNLLGREKTYCVENPGYRKTKQVYESAGARCVYADMDESGIKPEEIRKNGADVVHITPTRHFPTGIAMPVSRRYELLAWANEEEGRFVIEDDYDSEFRASGRPISPFYNIDVCEKVVYMNTFSKSLAPTIRIAYMVLPQRLSERYRRELGFYASTVSTFEQRTLAAFIAQGYFEKHINRMRLYYGRKRKQVMEIVREELPSDRCKIVENDSGLHFNVWFDVDMSDAEAQARLRDHGIAIRAVSEYCLDDQPQNLRLFILNYSSVKLERLPDVMKTLRKALEL